MKLKLKEDPREWLKFTAVMALALAILGAGLHLRNVISRTALFCSLAMLVLGLALCWGRPRWFRGFYRSGMTASFHVGQILGKVILTVFFLVMVTPLGLLLRLLGKDLLNLKRDSFAMTYWRPAKTSHQFDRQF
jgi:hypothetical protein